MGGSLRLSLPDGVVEVTPDMTPEQRQQILHDLRSRYPEILDQSPELEGLILGTGWPAEELLVEDITTPEGQRKALEDMRTAMPELLRQDPRIERALMGDRQALDELAAEGGSVSASLSLVKDTSETVSPPAADGGSALPAAASEGSGPVAHPKGILARLFGRR